jgi:hypothetical protein
MASGTLQDSLNKDSTGQVYHKTSNILAVIISHANTGCVHCLDLIKSGLREPTPNPADEPVPEPVISNVSQKPNV